MARFAGEAWRRPGVPCLCCRLGAAPAERACRVKKGRQNAAYKASTDEKRHAEPARKPALSSVRLNMPWESMTIADGGCGGGAIDSIKDVRKTVEKKNCNSFFFSVVASEI